MYSTGPEDAAVVMCLHGAGYTGLTWSLVATRLKEKWVHTAACATATHHQIPWLSVSARTYRLINVQLANVSLSGWAMLFS